MTRLVGSGVHCVDCSRPLAPGATWLWGEADGRTAVLCCPTCWDGREARARAGRDAGEPMGDGEVVVVVRMPAGSVRDVEQPLTGLPTGASAVAVTGVVARAVLAVLDRRRRRRLDEGE